MTRQHKNQHIWGWQGFDADGREWELCEACGKWAYDGIRDRRYLLTKGPEATWEAPPPSRGSRII